MLDDVSRFIHRNKLLEPGARVVVGLSGGADSVALLLCLKSLGYQVCAAHLNHGIRGKSAEGDELFVKTLCSNIGVPLIRGRADVPALAGEHGRTLEEAGRAARYDFLEEARQEFRAQAIAVAHHLDDQAESVLMHLIRGSGLRGLAGMRPKRGAVIRPFLEVDRARIERFLYELGQDYHTDETNLIPSGARNQIRLVVLPAMRKINPAVARAISSAALLTAQDEDYLCLQAVNALNAARDDKGYLCAALSSLPPPLRARAVMEALSRAGMATDIARKHVGMVEGLLTAATGSSVSLPNGSAWVEYGRLRVGCPEPKRYYEADLIIPGDTQTPWGVFHAKVLNGPVLEKRPDAAYLDFDKLPSAIKVRSRRDGDRFHPLGAPGSRKLKSYFIDKKTARADRETPLLASDGRVLYVYGHCVCDEARVTPFTRRTLIITKTNEEERHG